jgi:antiviral helicase SLH1
MAISLLLAVTKKKTPRIVGLASSLGDTESLADWLDVPTEGTYCFPPTERDQALSVTFQTFTIPYSAALMKAMAKPVYDLLNATAKGESAIVFVPSAGQCPSVVSDLLTQCALGMNMKGFLGEDVSQDVLEIYTERLKNRDIVDGIMRGMGTWHNRMEPDDKVLVMRLFAEGIIRVLVAPREACWDTPVRAGLVIVMGTQHMVRVQSKGNAGDSRNAEKRIIDYTMHELVRMQGKAVRHGKTGHFHILCQAEQRDTYMRFLTEGLPLESQLLGSEQDEGESLSVSKILLEWIKDQRKVGMIKSRQDIIDFLTYTLLFRRIEKNPTYYDVQHDPLSYLSRVADVIWERSNSHSW